MQPLTTAAGIRSPFCSELLHHQGLPVFDQVELLCYGCNDVGGQLAVFFVLVVAAVEVVVGLAIVVAINRRRRDATADDVALLRG